MRNRKVLAAALACLALGASAGAASAQAFKATPGDALKRLERLLTRHGSRVSGGVIRRLDAKDFRGCKITYELTPQVAPDHKGYVPFTERVTVNLSDIDPAGVEARGGDKGAAVGFVTRGGRSTIEYRVAQEPHTFGDPRRLRAHHVSVTNRAAAEEVRAAMARAAELCGP